MLNPAKKSVKYLFGIVPLAAIIFTINLNKPADERASKMGAANLTNNTAAKNESDILLNDLPCGFKALGSPILPEKPTFVTGGIPVLQYPAGSYPGTAAQITNVIYSERQNDQLILQPDGNLVIYCITCNPSKAIWSSQTNGKGGQALFFQPNGDLVLRNANGKVIWHSNIISKCAGSEQAYFTLQDDGNLIMLYNQTIGGASPDQSTTVAAYLGGTGATNDQPSPHPGKIQ